MKTYFYYLSSLNPTLSGLILDGYLFLDPTTGSPTTLFYPNTADGGIGSPSNFGSTISYSVTAWDGLFYPYGYQAQDVDINDVLPNLKGDYTIVFSASTSNLLPLKMMYDFGDGGAVVVVNKPIANGLIFSSLNSYLFGLNADSPIYHAVSNDYYALSCAHTFFPSITVLNNNLSYIYYNLRVTIFPNSVYDLSNLHLLNTTQLQSTTGNNFNIVEIDNNQITTNIQLQQVLTTPYPVPYIQTSTPSVSSPNQSMIPESEESLVFTID